MFCSDDVSCTHKIMCPSKLHIFIYFLNDVELSVNKSTPDSFLIDCWKFDFDFYPIFNTCAVALVNLLRFSLTSKEEFQELPSEHTF